MTEPPRPPDDLSDSIDFQRAYDGLIETAVDNEIDGIGSWTVNPDAIPEAFDVEIIRYATSDS